MTNPREAIRRRLLGGAPELPTAWTRRDVRVHVVPHKAIALHGVRGAGTTGVIRDAFAELSSQGRPREAMALLVLDEHDETLPSLADLEAEVIPWVSFHAGEGRRPVVAFDGIDAIPRWEGLIRRILDLGTADIILSVRCRSSVLEDLATPMVGRVMPIEVLPFGWRETLRSSRSEPVGNWESWKDDDRIRLDLALRRFLVAGGFPGLSGVADADRKAQLAQLVDLILLRDIIEPNAVANPRALRWLQRRLFSSAAGRFTVGKLLPEWQATGGAAAKDTMHLFLGFLEDVGLIRTTWLHDPSERRRMVHPRMVFPVDPALVALGPATEQAALATAVAMECVRRGFALSWVRTRDDQLVDIRAERVGEPARLVQPVADALDTDAVARASGALAAARAAAHLASATLVTLGVMPPAAPMPEGVRWMPAVQWFLQET